MDKAQNRYEQNLHPELGVHELHQVKALHFSDVHGLIVTLANGRRMVLDTYMRPVAGEGEMVEVVDKVLWNDL